MANREIEAILRISSKLGSMTALTTLQQKLAAVDKQAKAYNRTNSAMARGLDATMLAAQRALAPAALTYGAVKAISAYADIERKISRIGITAEASVGQTSEAMGRLRNIASQVRMPFEQVVDAADSLVSSGKSLEETYALLPAISKTAQASGAEIADVATTADALSVSLGITAGQMESAFDKLAFAGKQGKFELRDMAGELPSLAPAFAALGYKGEESIGKLAAMLQAVRKETGSSGEAATALQNIFQKMYSAETEKKFDKFGIKMRKRLKEATEQGEDLLDAFVDLSLEATKGDMSQLPLLFTDAQYLQGMRALINQKEMVKELQAAMRNAAGTIGEDARRIANDTRSALDQLSDSFSQFYAAGGKLIVDAGATDVMDAFSEQVARGDAIKRWLDASGMSEVEKWQWRFRNIGPMGTYVGTEADAAAHSMGFRTLAERQRELLGQAQAEFRDSGPGPRRLAPGEIPIPVGRPDVAPRSTYEIVSPNYMPGQVPVPTARPSEAEIAELERQRQQREFLEEMARQDAARGYNVRLSEPREETRFDAFEANQGSAGRAISEMLAGIENLAIDLKDSGEAAGQSMQQGVEQGGDAAGRAIRAAFDAAVPALAAAIRNAVANISVNARVSGGVNADVGRSGGDVARGGGPR